MAHMVCLYGRPYQKGHKRRECKYSRACNVNHSFIIGDTFDTIYFFFQYSFHFEHLNMTVQLFLIKIYSIGKFTKLITT